MDQHEPWNEAYILLRNIFRTPVGECDLTTAIIVLLLVKLITWGLGSMLGWSARAHRIPIPKDELWTEEVKLLRGQMEELSMSKRISPYPTLYNRIKTSVDDSELDLSSPRSQRVDSCNFHSCIPSLLTTMAPDDLILFHPQWQGCGQDDAVRHGAAAVRRRLEADLDIQFHLIDVDAETEMRGADTVASSPIKGMSSLVSNYDQVQRAVEDHRPSRIFTLGGDCGVSLYPVGWLNDRLDDFAVLWIVAHADLNTPASSPSGNFHGMVLRSIMDGVNIQGKKVFKGLRPEQVLLVGTRDLDAAEEEFIGANGIETVDCKDISTDRILLVLRERGIKNVYLHVDVDVMDPDDFGYSFYQVPDGIKMEALREIIVGIRESGDVEIVGGSLKEVVGGIERDQRALGGLCRIFTSLCGSVAAQHL